LEGTITIDLPGGPMGGGGVPRRDGYPERAHHRRVPTGDAHPFHTLGP
jgi:hypothetical protein